MKNLAFLCLILAMPFTVTAQSKLSSLHFFDALPGLPTAANKTVPTLVINSKLFERFGAGNLSGITNLQDLQLSGSAEEKSWQIQRLVEYRTGLRLGSPGMNGSLEEDLNWAAKMGFQYPNRQQLTDVYKNLSERDFKNQIQYAQSLPAPLNTSFLDGVIGSTNNFSDVLEFLAKNPNLFPPERRSQLILNATANLSMDSLSAKDVENAKALSRFIDYSDNAVICRSAGFFALGMATNDVPSASTLQIEYYKALSKGLVEMQKKGLPCDDYMGGKSAKEVLELAEDMGIFARGTAAASTIGTDSQPDPKLKGCQIDEAFRNEVLMELSGYASLKVGGSRLFGRNTKGRCSLQIVAKKTSEGFNARIVLFNSKGDQLIYFDQSFLNTQQMAAAALENRKPPVDKANSPPHVGKPSLKSSTKTKAAH